MSANPYPGDTQSETTMPMMMDPRALPFPPQLAHQHDEHVAMYGYADETMAMPAQMPYADHGPMMAPVTEPAYPADRVEYYAPLEPATAASGDVRSTQVTVEQRRRRIMLGATAGVLIVAAIAFAVAWQVASGDDDASAKGSTSSEQIDAPDGGGAEPTMDADGMVTPPATGAAGSSAIGGPGAIGARPGAGAAKAAPRVTGGGSAPITMPSMGNMPMPGGSTPPSGGYRNAPAVEPVSGTPSAAPRPAAARPRPAAPTGGAMGAMPGMATGAGAGTARTADTPTADPVVTGNVVQPGATTASTTQLIIALKTTSGAWQLYKTDPRRVALQSNPAGANLQGAARGLVWLANSWQPAYILAGATGSGATGGGAATPVVATGGGAPMKR